MPESDGISLSVDATTLHKNGDIKHSPYPFLSEARTQPVAWSPEEDIRPSSRSLILMVPEPP